METSSIILLVVSASISFGLGRFFVHSRNKKREAEKQRMQQLVQRLAQEARRNLPPEAESKNKAKRKRQQSDALK